MHAHPRGSVPPARKSAGSEKGQCECRGGEGCLAMSRLPFRTGQVGSGLPSPSRFPTTFWGLDSESPPSPLSPSYLCSLTCEDEPLSPPCSPHTSPGIQVFQRCLTHPELYIANYTELYSLHPASHTVSQSFSHSFRHSFLSHSCTHRPPLRCSHTRVTCGLTCRAPTLQRCTLAAHTCAHTRSVIILDMPFLLCDSSSGDAQSCHLDEK